MGKVMQEGSDGITSKPNDLALIFTLSHNVSVGQSSGPPVWELSCLLGCWITTRDLVTMLLLSGVSGLGMGGCWGSS